MPPRYTVIIPSAKAANVAACVAAIRRNQPDCDVICVADGIPQTERDCAPGVRWVDGVAPFCFSRNVNLGIRAAGEADVILMNDDARLETPGGFDRLAAASRAYGIVSPVIRGRCCNPRQTEPAKSCVSEPSFLSFICAYISRDTIERVGHLDERFFPGNWEDNDYCKRTTMAGIALGICGLCTVEHREETTFGNPSAYQAILAANQKRFVEKWAFTHTALSICVCSIFSRSAYLAKLMSVLSPQFCGRMEFLLSTDNGQASIGEKRQRLLEQARGEFIVFIDDDDLVPADYVSKILTAILRNPSTDAITYKAKCFCNGVYEADCYYSIKTQGNSGVKYLDGVKTYERFPYHVTPIRRELALQVGFQPKDFMEDTDFALRLKPLIKSEEFIDEFLYTYFWRADRVNEVTHRRFTEVDAQAAPPAPTPQQLVSRNLVNLFTQFQPMLA